MDWQESLRVLDKQLADGEISPSEHRKMRDEILAQASSSGGRVSFSHPNPEATQVISRPEGAQPSVVLPPITREHRAAGSLDGMEVFTSARSARPKPWRTALAVFAVLALVGTGVWWVAFRGDGPAPSAREQRQPTVQATGSPGDRLAATLPTPTGTASPNNSTLSIDRAVELKLLSLHDAQLYRDHGVTEIVYRGSRSGAIGLMVLAVPAKSEAEATAIAAGVHDHLTKVGFADISGTKPTSFTRTDAQFTTFGTVYRSGGVCVQVSVSSRPQEDPARVRAAFDELLANVANALPES